MLLTRRIKTGRVHPFDELHCAKLIYLHRCFGLRYQGTSQTTRRPFELGRESQDIYMWYVFFTLDNFGLSTVSFLRPAWTSRRGGR